MLAASLNYAAQKQTVCSESSGYHEQKMIIQSRSVCTICWQFLSKVDKDSSLLKAAAITANTHTIGMTGAGSIEPICLENRQLTTPHQF